MVLLQRKLYFSKISEGVQLFPGGGGGPACSRGGGSSKWLFLQDQTISLNLWFSRGVWTPMYIPLYPHMNLWFSRGGSGHPIPPLDPHMNREAVKLIEPVWICGQTDKTYIAYMRIYEDGVKSNATCYFLPLLQAETQNPRLVCALLSHTFNSMYQLHM